MKKVTTQKGDKRMYDLYELKSDKWLVVDTFSDLAEAIEYFGPDTVFPVSGDVYSVNAGDDISMLRILIRCKVAQ